MQTRWLFALSVNRTTTEPPSGVALPLEKSTARPSGVKPIEVGVVSIATVGARSRSEWPSMKSDAAVAPNRRTIQRAFVEAAAVADATAAGAGSAAVNRTSTERLRATASAWARLSAAA